MTIKNSANHSFSTWKILFLSIGFLGICLFTVFTGVEKTFAAADVSPHVAASQQVELGHVQKLILPDALALPVVQQPEGDASFVSGQDGQLTEFGLASQYGNVGLLAHNHLAGRSFPQIAFGQEIQVMYTDGHIETFIVTEILQYQALEPDSPWSSFRSLSDNSVMSASQMFRRVYTGDHHVTLQTCIDAEGDASWGRLFILAVPKTTES